MRGDQPLRLIAADTRLARDVPAREHDGVGIAERARDSIEPAAVEVEPEGRGPELGACDKEVLPECADCGIEAGHDINGRGIDKGAVRVHAAHADLRGREAGSALIPDDHVDGSVPGDANAFHRRRRVHNDRLGRGCVAVSAQEVNDDAAAVGGLADEGKGRGAAGPSGKIRRPLILSSRREASLGRGHVCWRDGKREDVGVAAQRDALVVPEEVDAAAGAGEERWCVGVGVVAADDDGHEHAAARVEHGARSADAGGAELVRSAPDEPPLRAIMREGGLVVLAKAGDEHRSGGREQRAGGGHARADEVDEARDPRRVVVAAVGRDVEARHAEGGADRLRVGAHTPRLDDGGLVPVGTDDEILTVGHQRPRLAIDPVAEHDGACIKEHARAADALPAEERAVPVAVVDAARKEPLAIEARDLKADRVGRELRRRDHDGCRVEHAAVGRDPHRAQPILEEPGLGHLRRVQHEPVLTIPRDLRPLLQAHATGDQKRRGVDGVAGLIDPDAEDVAIALDGLAVDAAGAKVAPGDEVLLATLGRGEVLLRVHGGGDREITGQ